MTNLIDHADRIFVAGHRGMAGSAIQMLAVPDSQSVPGTF